MHADHQNKLSVDIAMLLEKSFPTDLVEVFCSPDSMLTWIAQQSGLAAERWSMDEIGLSTIFVLEKAGDVAAVLLLLMLM